MLKEPNSAHFYPTGPVGFLILGSEAAICLRRSDIDLSWGRVMLERTSSARNKNIPTYLPLAEAADKFGLSKKVLAQMIQAGKIEAVQLPSGELLVAAEL